MAAKAKRTSRRAASNTSRKATTKAKASSKKLAAGFPVDPIDAPGAPAKFRARVRMYRQGLGDCFLITLPRKKKEPFQILIDCGALEVKKEFMSHIVAHIRDTVGNGKTSGKARLDVVVGTHEHKDHLSGFNQARDIFDNDFDIGAVWLGWTENLTKAEIKKIKDAKRKAVASLQAALASPVAGLAVDAFSGVGSLLGFSSDTDNTGARTIADALEYLKVRGKDAGDLQYLEPGSDPIELEGCDGVRVFVLGPPRDPMLLKGSEVTEKMKKDGVIYHLARTGDAGMNALVAAVSLDPSANEDRCYPFSREHRIARSIQGPRGVRQTVRSPYFNVIKDFVAATYDDPNQRWRQIDHDWLNAFGQLALDLDNDTNNTSLVLAFEFEKTREVLLFVGDAQVGNWRSWANVEFQVPGRSTPLPAHDLLGRTVFYKVGHHCSHNSTLRLGGLELMNRDDLVAFIPLDKGTAAKQGKHGWDMPAGPLHKALRKKTAERVAISDVAEKLPKAAENAGVRATDTYIDYFLI